MDGRLRELGAVLGRWLGDSERAAVLLAGIAAETWDYLAEQEPDDPPWPPTAAIDLRVHPDDVTVEVDAEPGLVRVRLTAGLQALLQALAADSEALQRLVKACTDARGANATH